MALRFIVAFSVLVVLAQGSQISPVEQENAVKAHQSGGPSSTAAITFPTVRPAPAPGAPVPKGGNVASGGHRHGGSHHRRPSVGAKPGRQAGSIHQNRNPHQKPY